MGFAEEMTNLGEHLISSFDNRIKDVKKCFAATHNLRREAQGFLDRTRSEQKTMARNLHANLHKFCNNLQNDTGETLKRFSGEHRSMAKKQNNMLKNFTQEIGNRNHQFMKKCEQQREKLCDEFERGHKNFQRAMKEKNRHMNAVHFQEYREPTEPRKMKKKAKAEKASPTKGMPKKCGRPSKKRRRVTK